MRTMERTMGAKSRFANVQMCECANKLRGMSTLYGGDV